jgi:hypothetical protein
LSSTFRAFRRFFIFHAIVNWIPSRPRNCKDNFHLPFAARKLFFSARPRMWRVLLIDLSSKSAARCLSASNKRPSAARNCNGIRMCGTGWCCKPCTLRSTSPVIVLHAMPSRCVSHHRRRCCCAATKARRDFARPRPRMRYPTVKLVTVMQMLVFAHTMKTNAFLHMLYMNQS